MNQSFTFYIYPLSTDEGGGYRAEMEGCDLVVAVGDTIEEVTADLKECFINYIVGPKGYV